MNCELDNLNTAQVEELLKVEENELALWADEVRSRYCGDEVHLRGVIEFSNYCIRDCLYCGLRRSNKKLTRYRMTTEEIVERALMGFQAGVKTIVLQSGDDLEYREEDISRIIHLIKAKVDVAITLSVGERDYREYSAWKKAGADRYLLKHETANPVLYSGLHPGQTLSHRLKILGWLKEIGYQVGAGNLVGLPGQTLRDLADDILFMKELDVEMAGIGPYIPHPDTPLGRERGGSLNMTLKVLAVARIVLRDVHLPATTAVGSIHPEGREKALLKAGANVVMPNITPKQYRPLYQIYPGKICLDEDFENCLGCLAKRIESCGRKIAKDKGHSLKGNIQCLSLDNLCGR
ncbi:[FeFe] hydrogenase H-cluster radical SAM maturase HydE [Candidatus Acetothermia bacterium]|jgi:biotin synthase|nr:[FeFe] hydrogenase H-cluster radical SAM maturase HydE [Candidatus Acetothermia bacterium]